MMVLLLLFGISTALFMTAVSLEVVELILTLSV